MPVILSSLGYTDPFSMREVLSKDERFSVRTTDGTCLSTEKNGLSLALLRNDRSSREVGDAETY
jgi:hypothetical protein